MRPRELLLLGGLTVIVLAACLVAAGGLGRYASSLDLTGEIAREEAPEFTFTAAGDYGATRNTSQTLDLVGQTRPAFHLAVGDLSYDDLTPPSRWCDYVHSHVGRSIPVEVVSGNREDFNTSVRDPGGGNIDQFAACLPNRISTMSGHYGREYYFDYPQRRPLARFIFLSPELTFEDGLWRYDKNTDHYKQTARAIDDARNQAIPWVVVAAHKPCLSMGYQACGTGSDLLNLLMDKKVDLVLNGHDHTYQRTAQLALGPECEVLRAGPYNRGCVVDEQATSFSAKGEGTVFVTVGTGGQGLSALDLTSPQAPYFVSSMGSNADATYGLLSVHVTRTQLSATFLRSAGGSFGDTFTIGDFGAPAARAEAQS